MELNEAYVSLFTQLQKLLKGLSPEAAQELAEGSSKVVIIASGQRVVQEVAGLDAALKAVRALSEEDLDKVTKGGSTLKLVRKGGKVVYPISVAEVAEEVSKLETEDAIIKYLDSDDRLKPADLRRVATELGISVPTNAKTKPAIETHIARSLVSFGVH